MKIEILGSGGATITPKPKKYVEYYAVGQDWQVGYDTMIFEI